MDLSNVFVLFKLAQYFESSESFSSFIERVNTLDADSGIKKKLLALVAEIKSIYEKIVGEVDVQIDLSKSYEDIITEELQKTLELLALKESYPVLKTKILDVVNQLRKIDNEEFSKFAVSFLSDMRERVEEEIEAIEEEYEEVIQKVDFKIIEHIRKEEKSLNNAIQKLQQQKQEIERKDIEGEFESVQERDYLTRSIEYEEKHIQHKLSELDYFKAYREKNKEKLREVNKQYYEKNKDRLRKKSKQYSIDNKESISDKKKQYYSENKQSISEKNQANRRKYTESAKKFFAAMKALKINKQLYASEVDSMIKENPQIITLLGDDFESIIDNTKKYLRSRR